MISLIFSLAMADGAVSFNKDIKPIFEKYCVECHTGIVNYEVANLQKDKIFNKVVKGNVMPPNFRLKLTDYEKNLVKRWVESGTK